MLFLLVPLHNLTDLNRLLSNNIATALYLGKSNIYYSFVSQAASQNIQYLKM